MGTKKREESYKLYLKDNAWKSPKILRSVSGISSILMGYSYPIHVTIDPIEICNQSCEFCYYHGSRNKDVMKNSTFTGKGIFPYQRLISLIKELGESGTQAISFTGTGETLLYPNIYNIFNEIIKNSIEFGITTNLSVNIPKEGMNILSKASWIRCSLNAATEDTYKKVHNSDNFKIVLNNIKSLPNINISYAYFSDNIDEIVKVTKLVKKLGANSIFFRPEMTFFGNKVEEKYRDKITRNLKEAKSYEDSNFKVYKTVDDIFVKEDLLCYHSNHTIYIDSYGDVYPCCVTKYDKKFIYGNILNKNFNEFWNSEERINHYKSINMKNCPPCKHYVDNSILELLYNNDESRFNKFI